jgi:two-component system CheB/CheR fusion protein
VSHLTHLVDDLLDIMRIKHGKTRLQRSRLDLVEVVRNTVEDHRALLQRHSATLRLPPEPLWVNGDRTRLAQVVGNLLTNAAKFTPEGGKIAVALSRREGRAILEVTDTGIGIDKEMLGRLFQPFAQADRSLDRSRGGLGLGLKLVRELVSLHEGEVDASSAGPGRGARFIVSLPCEVQTTETRATDASQDEAAPASRNVLVIEDHRDAAETLAEALELFGHHVAIAYDGPSGLAKARELRPEVVLCDIGLPAGMDGYAVSRALREDPSTKSMFLVALTGYAEPADRRRAMDAGFDAHVAKPPDLAALRGLLAGADHR